MFDVCTWIVIVCIMSCLSFGGFFFFQAEDGIRDLVRSRGLGDVYKRQSSRSPKGAIAFSLLRPAVVKGPNLDTRSLIVLRHV